MMFELRAYNVAYGKVVSKTIDEAEARRLFLIDMPIDSVNWVMRQLVQENAQATCSAGMIRYVPE